MFARQGIIVLSVALIASSVRGEEVDGVTVIKMDVQAIAAPKPALKYTLLPELRDMQPGNPIPGYLKCFMEQNNLYHNKEAVEERERLLNCPLGAMGGDFSQYGGSSSRNADYAARLDRCDWQLLLKLKADGVSLLLPDVQQLRSLASVLKVRYRGLIKDGKYDDAVRNHQTMFALAGHLGEHPTLIGNLVGLAIANLAIGPFEEMLQQPGCPSMYWALANLPTSVVDLRKGLQGERIIIAAEFGKYSDPTRVWDDDDVSSVRARVRNFRGLIGFAQNQKISDDKLEEWLLARLKDQPWQAAAEKRLIDSGLPAARVKKYPPEQILFFDLLAKYEIARDELMKWATQPFWQSDEAMLKAITPGEKPTEEEVIVKGTLPALQKVRRAQARVDQRLALLQTVEALRLHAFDNGGKLPQSLRDVKVPLRVDPISGMPFIYKLNGNTASVQGTAPKGEEKIPNFNIRYELTIRK